MEFRKFNVLGYKNLDFVNMLQKTIVTFFLYIQTWQLLLLNQEENFLYFWGLHWRLMFQIISETEKMYLSKLGTEYFLTKKSQTKGNWNEIPKN